jgi:hypothetical protein
VVAERAVLVAGVWGQLVGRIGREAALGDTALGLPHCPQVHTAFLRVPLDVAFCAADGAVLRVVTLAPWRVSPWVSGAAVAWEARAGLLAGRVDERTSRLIFEPR